MLLLFRRAAGKSVCRFRAPLPACPTRPPQRNHGHRQPSRPQKATRGPSRDADTGLAAPPRLPNAFSICSPLSRALSPASPRVSASAEDRPEAAVVISGDGREVRRRDQRACRGPRRLDKKREADRSRWVGFNGSPGWCTGARCCGIGFCLPWAHMTKGRPIVRPVDPARSPIVATFH
jgi:hypothetical protein